MCYRKSRETPKSTKSKLHIEISYCSLEWFHYTAMLNLYPFLRESPSISSLHKVNNSTKPEDQIFSTCLYKHQFKGGMVVQLVLLLPYRSGVRFKPVLRLVSVQDLFAYFFRVLQFPVTSLAMLNCPNVCG